MTKRRRHCYRDVGTIGRRRAANGRSIRNKNIAGLEASQMVAKRMEAAPSMTNISSD